jgi:hypothetical protein
MKSAQIIAFTWDFKYNHHPANTMMAHLLTSFGVTHLEQSVIVSPAFFCL